MLKSFFEFCPKHPSFPTTQNPKKLFLIYKNIFRPKTSTISHYFIEPLKTKFDVLNNNFSYTQLYFVFLLQEDSYFYHGDTDTFFIFRKILISVSVSVSRKILVSVCIFFFFRKILISFVFFFSKFFFVFLIVFIYHFYIYTKL